MLGKIAQNILLEILSNLNADADEINLLLKNTLTPVTNTNLIGFASMMEVFKYNCTGPSGKFRIPCGDHRDVSLLTLIPKCRGPSGLEVFNWNGFWDKTEEKSDESDCVVLAGELLHRLTAGKISPTSHRVVVTTNDVRCDHELAARFSCPMELLLGKF